MSDSNAEAITLLKTLCARTGASMQAANRALFAADGDPAVATAGLFAEREARLAREEEQAGPRVLRFPEPAHQGEKGDA